MKRIFYLSFLIVLVSACNNKNEKLSNRPEEYHGAWKAEWETPPEAYPGVVDLEFYMDGQFIFTKDSLTVSANGYPDCIFSEDTLSHSQSWYVSNDTLFLVNDSENSGMTYKMISKSADRIKLQLLEDIFITLSK